jgi:hypothetical protein
VAAVIRPDEDFTCEIVGVASSIESGEIPPDDFVVLGEHLVELRFALIPPAGTRLPRVHGPKCLFSGSRFGAS